MAVDANSVSVILGAPGQSGSSQVVTAAGLVFTQAANPASTSAYWNWNGTNLVGNVPTGGGLQFTVNGTQQAALSTAGMGTFGPTTGANVQVGGIAADSAVSFPFNGTEAGRVSRDGTKRIGIFGNADDGANAIGLRVGAMQNYTTAGGKTIQFGHNWNSSFTENASLNAVASPNATGIVGQLNAPHIAGSTTALSLNTCRIGLGAGTTSSGTAVTASGHDLAGRVGVTVNSTGTANQPILLIAWANAYNTPPFVQLTPANAAAATAPLNTQPFAVATTSGFAIMGNATGIAAGTYAWLYTAVQ